mgnify:CR=1 FL=1|jgi:hypothetical protein|tara:strand:+ start:400 stop:594 length:195 start_codon:yes stop_codon:yes gene_type:complete
MRRGVLALLSCFLIFATISFVAADDLSDCVNKCKINFDEEVDRSPCITECKTLYDFDDNPKDSG